MQVENTMSLELNLVAVKNTKTNEVIYYAVNDRHYDGMLAGEVEGYSWAWMGSVFIEEPNLNEQGYYYCALTGGVD